MQPKYDAHALVAFKLIIKMIFKYFVAQIN
jgi:hypothetical protein